MALTKRGHYWFYDFIYKKRRYQGSTHQSNVNKARLVQAKLKSDLALQSFGIGPEKESPYLFEFLENRFLEHVSRHAKARRTYLFYREKVKQILRYERWRDLRASMIDAGEIDQYTAWRLRSVAPITVNHDLVTLRKALRLAEEWRLISKAPKVRLLPGIKSRDFVVSPELEQEYLAVAMYPLQQVGILMLDAGLRPEECVRLRKVDISENALLVPGGKTENARRILPMTERTTKVVEVLLALFPDSEWLFPGKKGGHYTRGALDNAFAKLRTSQGWPVKLVLHSLRHTFATRLAESGAGPFEIQAALGHHDIRMSQRYVHPSTEHMALALRRKEAYDKMMRGESEVPAVFTKPGRN